jgi:hypothetical protein
VPNSRTPSIKKEERFAILLRYISRDARPFFDPDAASILRPNKHLDTATRVVLIIRELLLVLHISSQLRPESKAMIIIGQQQAHGHLHPRRELLAVLPAGPGPYSMQDSEREIRLGLPGQ